jgi:hypothetical protein
MAISLSSIKRTKHDPGQHIRPENVALSVFPVIAKTTSDAQAPKPIFIRTEDGLD